MADVAVTPTALVLDTESADILDTDGTAITDAANNTWAIAAGGRHGSLLLLKFWDDGTGTTITILAGDRPPSQRAGLGDKTITLAANDVRYIVVEAARFLQDDGTIRATATVNGAEAKAFTLPKIY